MGERGGWLHDHGKDDARLVAVRADEERNVDRLATRKDAPRRFAYQVAVEDGAGHRARRPDLASGHERGGGQRATRVERCCRRRTCAPFQRRAPPFLLATRARIEEPNAPPNDPPVEKRPEKK